MFPLVYLAAKTAATGDGASEGLAEKIAAFFDYFIGQIPSWIAGVIVFILSFGVAKIVKAAIESRLADKIDDEHQEVMVLAGRVSYFGALIFGITIALKIAGIDLTAILAAIAFGIGFALQDLIMNFLSGVLILMSRQFTIGDFIKVGETTGKVVEIQTRATILKAFDGTKVIVPNSAIFRNQVVSYTTNPTRRVSVPIYISYDTDIKYAMQVALKVLKKHPKILKKPGPTIVVSNFGDATIDLSGRFWVGSRDGWFKTKSDIIHKMWEAMNKAGIQMPFNTLHIETSADTKVTDEQYAKIREVAMAQIAEKKKLKASTAQSQGQTQQNAAPTTTSALLPTTSATVPPAAPAQSTPAGPTTTPTPTPQAAGAIAPLTPAVAVAPVPEGQFLDENEIDAAG